jgi:hypothetical protein
MQVDWLLSGWKLKTEGVILPEERLPAAQTVLVGIQHVVASSAARYWSRFLSVSIPT